MNLNKFFQKFILISGFLLVFSIAPSLEVSATVVDGYTIPGQDALQEIVEEQEETVVIGGEEEQTEYSIPANKVAIEYTGKIDATTGEAVKGTAVNVGEDEENESEYSIPANKVAIEYSGKIDATTGEAAIGSAVNMGEDYF
ncbi:MAG: hypothetical protein IKW21_08365, partial [Lachnospiraceae bacterium]|nr:hypothetical protein [Lachnospiraceae bacterium]